MMITLTCPSCGKDRSYRKLPIPDCPHCQTPYPEDVVTKAMANLRPRSIRWSANLTIGGLVAATLFITIGTIGDIAAMNMFSEQSATVAPVTQAAPPAAVQPSGALPNTGQIVAELVIILMGILMFMSPISFILWFYLAYSNLERAGFTGLEYSPWEPLWVFFVPIRNLFRPYRIMQELWQGSHALAHGEFEGRAWQQQGDSKLVLFWWASFLTAIGTVFVSDPSLVGQTASNIMLILSISALIGSGVLAITMVRTISDLQEDGRAVHIA